MEKGDSPTDKTIFEVELDSSSDGEDWLFTWFDDLCGDTPFGTYLIAKRCALKEEFGLYFLGYVLSSFIKKRIPEKNSKILLSRFTQIERAYGTPIAEFVLTELLLLIHIFNWSIRDDRIFKNGPVDHIQKKRTGELPRGKRKPADLMTHEKKKHTAKTKRLLDAWTTIHEFLLDQLDSPHEVEKIFKPRAIHTLITERGPSAELRRLNEIKELPPRFRKPLKAFVCRVLRRLKPDKKTAMSATRLLADILENAKIRKAQGFSYAIKDIHDLARHCEEYL